MTDMPPLPPPTPSIKLTLEGLAALLGLKVCSHGDLGFAFGSGPVLASHEAATVIREVVANLRARAREEGEAAESLRAQLGETSNTLAEVSEILHRAWPEHMSGDPVQLAKMTTAAAARIAAAEVIAAAGKREAEERAASEISRMLGRIAELEYQRAEGRKRLGVLLGAPADEDLDDLVGRIRDLLELRPRYDAVKARAEADELEIRQLRAQLAETSAVLADVTEILHRAWPEHMSGDPVQLAKAAAEAIVSSEAMRTETIAEGRKRVEAARLEIETLLESLRVARSAESARAEEVDTLLRLIDGLASGLPSCLEANCDRFGRAQRKIEAASLDSEPAGFAAPTVSKMIVEGVATTLVELNGQLADALDIADYDGSFDDLVEKVRALRGAHGEIRKILAAVWPAMEVSAREPRPTDTLELARAAAAEIARLTAPHGGDEATDNLRVLSPIHELHRGSAGASGRDLPVRLGVSLAPGRTVRVPTGVKMAIPEGFEGQVRPRSSAAARGILVHLGTIDADYRGEIEVIVTNLSGEWTSITKPVAQLVICPVAHPPMEYVETLDDTARGEGGFGSSDAIASGGYTNGAMVVVGKETK